MVLAFILWIPNPVFLGRENIWVFFKLLGLLQKYFSGRSSTVRWIFQGFKGFHCHYWPLLTREERRLWLLIKKFRRNGFGRWQLLRRTVRRLVVFLHILWLYILFIYFLYFKKAFCKIRILQFLSLLVVNVSILAPKVGIDLEWAVNVDLLLWRHAFCPSSLAWSTPLRFIRICWRG